MVVSGLPRPKADGGGLEIGESLPPPELLLVDPMTALDLAVLLRAARLDVAMPDPEGLHGQGKGEGELMPVVTLELADPEGKRPAQFSQERQAGALVQAPIEPQDAKPRAVIEGGV